VHLFLGDAGGDELGPSRAAVTCLITEDVVRVRTELGKAAEDWAHRRGVDLAIRHRVGERGFDDGLDDDVTRERAFDALAVAEIRAYVAVGARLAGEAPAALRERLLRTILVDRFRKRGVHTVAIHARPGPFDRAALPALVTSCFHEAKTSLGAAPSVIWEQPGPGSPLALADYIAMIVRQRMARPDSPDPFARAFERVRSKVAFVWDVDARVSYHRRSPLP